MNRTFTKTLTTASVTIAAAFAAVAVCLAGNDLASAKQAPVSRCLVNHLAVSMRQDSPGAGQRYATVTLQNTGKAACSTGGYVGLGLTNRQGKSLPTDAVRTGHPKMLSLKPGQKATEQLHWGIIQGGGKCISSAKHLLVTPPNDYHSFVLPWKWGWVCQNGRFMERPLTATAAK